MTEDQIELIEENTRLRARLELFTEIEKMDNVEKLITTLRNNYMRRTREMLDVMKERDALAEEIRLASVDDKALVEIGIGEIERGNEKQWHFAPIETKNDLYNRMRAVIAAIRPHIEAAERERCAKKIEPTGPRPCDCDSCDCGNKDDAERVAAWDEAMANAAAIRSGSVK